MASIQLIAGQEVVALVVEARDALFGTHLIFEPGWGEGLDFEEMMGLAAKSAVEVTKVTERLVRKMRGDLGIRCAEEFAAPESSALAVHARGARGPDVAMSNPG